MMTKGVCMDIWNDWLSFLDGMRRTAGLSEPVEQLSKYRAFWQKE
jgi:hypothetical protein